MADFSLSPDEVSSVCRQMTAQADDASAHIAELRGSQVGTGDFGGPAHAAIARQYVRTLDDVIPRLLAGYSSAGKSMTGALSDTLNAYAATEDEAAAAMRSINTPDDERRTSW